MIKNIAIRYKLYFTIGIMTLLIFLELITLWFTMHSLSAVRAYVEAEGLWSKAQKDATYHLYKYSVQKKEKDYDVFREFLKIPLGDKKARVELLSANGNYQKEYDGFREGRVNKADIKGMIKLFERFHRIYYIDKAIFYWTRGDSLISELMQTGALLHVQNISGKQTVAEDEKIRDRIDLLNTQLTLQEDNFSSVLGDGSRWLEDLVLRILVFTALFVEMTGLLISISISNGISVSIKEIISVIRSISNGDFSVRAKITSKDEMRFLADSINKMSEDLENNIAKRKKAEISLSETSKILISIVKAAPMAIIVTDLNLLVKIWNPAAQKTFGYEESEVIDKPLPIIPSEKMGEILEAHHKMIIEKTIIRMDSERITKQGEKVFVSISLGPLLNEKEEVSGIVRIDEDITQRHLNEVKILENEKRLNESQSVAHLGSWEWNIKINEITWSDELYKIFNIEKSNLKIDLEKYISYVHEEDRAMTRKNIEHALETKTAFDFYHRVWGKDKTVRIIHSKGSIIEFENGIPIKMSGIALDVTEAKKAEDKFKGLLESTPDALVIINKDGRIKLVNGQAEKLFGYSKKEMLEQMVEILIPESLNKIHVQHRSNYFHKPQTREMGAGLNLRAKRKDGSEFPVEISLGPIPMEEEILVAAAIRDITQKRKIEEQLVQQSQELVAANNDLEKIASHDIQEPLRTITSFIQLLNKKQIIIDDKDAQVYIQFVVNGAQKIQYLVNDLVCYAQIGKHKLETKEININDLINNILKELQPVIKTSEAKVAVAKLPIVLADPFLINILLKNLISNAIKFNKRKPEIFILGMENAIGWEFSIQDNGIGIDKPYFEKIFSISQRLNKMDEYEGTGTGLAICRRVLEKHNGKIWVESELDKGSSFIFTIPK